MNLKRILPIFTAFIILWNNLCLAERMWGNSGVSLGASIKKYNVSSMLWGDNDLLLSPIDVDSTGIMRVAIQIVNDDGSVRFEDELMYLSSIDQYPYYEPILAPDGEGGAYIVWLDEVGAHRYDIYLQHLNQDVEPQLNNGGVRILQNCPTDYSDKMRIVPMEEGLLFFFDVFTEVIDRRAYYHFGVIALDAQGNPQEGWNEDGRIIFQEDGVYYHTTSDPDQEGLWIIAHANNEGNRYFMNKYLWNGEMLFEENIVPEIPDYFYIYDICSDQSGGLYICFSTHDASGLIHYNSEGELSWQAEDGIVFHELGDYELGDPKMQVFQSDDSEEIYLTNLVWNSDENRGLINVMMLNHGENGLVESWEQPVPIETYSSNYETDLLGNNTLLVLVNDELPRNEDADSTGYSNELFYKIDRDGNLVWGDDPLLIFNEYVREGGGGGFSRYGIITDTNGGFYAFYRVYGHYSVYSVNADGEFRWDNQFIRSYPSIFGWYGCSQLLENQVVHIYSHDSPHIRYRTINPDGSLDYPRRGRFVMGIDSATVASKSWATSGQNMALTWRFDNDVKQSLNYLRMVTDDGQLHPEAPLNLTDYIGLDLSAEISGDEIGNFFIKTRDRHADYGPAGILKITGECELFNDELLAPFPNLDPDFDAKKIIPDGEGGGWIWVWDESDYVYIQRIREDATLDWEEPIRFELMNEDIEPKILLPIADDCYMLLMTYCADDPENANIYAMLYDNAGEQVWDQVAIPFDPNPCIDLRYSLGVSAVTRTDGGVWVLGSGVNWDQTLELYLQKISIEGELLFDGRGLEIPPSKSGSRNKMIADSNDGLWFFWSRRIGEEFEECCALHINSEGEIIDDDGDEVPGILAFEGQYNWPHMIGAWDCFLYDDGSVGAIYSVGYNDQHYIAQRFQSGLNVSGSFTPNATEFCLDNVYPTPFNSRINITYSLSTQGLIALYLYDIDGRRLETVFNGIQSVGSHSISMDASHLPSGIYVIEMQGGSKSEQKKIVCVK
ncbi:T9SS type A sorting domain-containing protein [bacterium]|nr:T9SS type A sorting domain-containing protein [bacterium]